MPQRSLIAATLTLCACALLAGCSANFGAVSPVTTTTAAITGRAHGGRQPIVGAHIYLLEANTTAYAGPGIAASTANASKSLLSRGDGSDSIGTYVLTDAEGFFNISGDYTCDTGGQVYLYALGGEPDGVNTNSSAGLMAVLGPCGSFNASTTVVINEVSTIAAGYAFAGFATDATHVGAPSSTDTLAATGIANAFANAQQIFDATSANPDTPNVGAPSTTKYGGGTVPQQQVNTLANILSACVDTTVGGTQCATLFGGLMSGGTTGTEATDTATEAIYMAHNQTVTSIYTVTGSAPNPYTPWSNSTSLYDLGITLDFPNLNEGYHSVAVDADGGVWTYDQGSNTVAHVNHFGVSALGSPYSGGGLNGPSDISLDSQGNAWIANGNGSSATEIQVTSTPPVVVAIGTQGGTGIAVGKSDTVWLAGGALYEYSNSGTLLNTITQDNTTTLKAGLTAVDASGNVWVTTGGNNGSNQIAEFDSNGNPISAAPFSPGFIEGLAIDHAGDAWVVADGLTKIAPGDTSSTNFSTGANNADGIAIDGSGNVFYAYIGVCEYTVGGVNLPCVSGGPSYTIGTAAAIDGSGNLWSQAGNTTLGEFIGLATPVVTPLSVAAQTNQLGVRP